MRQTRYRFLLLPLIFAVGMRGRIRASQFRIDGHRYRPDGSGCRGGDDCAHRSGDWITKTTKSGSTGLYDINGLNPATYNLKVTAKGFQSIRAERHRGQRLVDAAR